MFDDLMIDMRSTYQNRQNRRYFVSHKDDAAVQRDQNGNLPPVDQQWYNIHGKQYRGSKEA
jgi:hypothetical protein